MRRDTLIDMVNAFIDEKIEREGLRPTIDFLLDCGLTYDELVDDLDFDTNDVDMVLESRG